jgi:MoxR-like ATPase
VAELKNRVTTEVGKVVVGQEPVVEQLLAALLVRSHVLLEGVPGVAKTLVANATARSLGLPFRRLQFTPDMLPSDVIGTMTLRGGDLTFRPGPVFTSVLLADEINRTPPKTQSALLEAMEERQVSIEGEPRPLSDPFLVIATQNPIEYEGTYPLPEAQLDRFIFKLELGYPDEAVERSILDLPRQGVVPSSLAEIQPVVSVDELKAARAEVDAVAVSGEVADYIVAIVRGTRTLPSIELGASPRATVHLMAASKAVAWLDDRTFVTPDDVAGIAPAVLRHRLLLHPEAELERYRPDDAVRAVLQAVPVPR